MLKPRKIKPDRYSLRFLGRELKLLVQRKSDREGWSQADVAEWLGVSHDQLSRWILGHVHPAADERVKLESLGVTDDDLNHLEQLDKVDYFRRSLDMSGDELLAAAREIRRREHQKK